MFATALKLAIKTGALQAAAPAFQEHVMPKVQAAVKEHGPTVAAVAKAKSAPVRAAVKQHSPAVKAAAASGAAAVKHTADENIPKVKAAVSAAKERHAARGEDQSADTDTTDNPGETQS